MKLKEVEAILKGKSMTAEEIAKELGVELTQENRQAQLSKIRRMARKVVDKNGGDRSERNEAGQLLYSLK